MTKLEALQTAANWAAHGLRLAGPRVGVMRDEPLRETPSGLIIPEEAVIKPIRGRLLLIGRGVDTTDPMSPLYELQVGDHVSFVKYNPTVFEVTLNGTSYQFEVMHMSDVYLTWPD